MKTILSSILLFLSLQGWGQQQISSLQEYSLMEPSNFWSVLVDTTAVPVPNFDPNKHVIATWYKFRNDTVIKGVPFKTLIKTTDQFRTWSVAGFLRQEGMRIYFFTGNREIMLYDFGLAIGESFKSAIYPDFDYVSRLDSIRDTTLNTTVRKIYYLTEYPENDPGKTQKEVWVEGVGSISDGLLRQTMLGITPNKWLEYQLMCFHQKETLVYQSKRYETDSDLNENNIQALVSPNKLWSTMYGPGPGAGCRTFFCQSYFTKFSGDTLIDGNSYLKVMRSEDKLMQNWMNDGFIREDANHKVFYRETKDKQEGLLYDFGCKRGEILHLGNRCIGDYLVDSIVIRVTDGVSRKHFYLHNLNNHFFISKEEWIEGIGSTWGIIDGGGNHCLLGGGVNLLCSFDGGIKNYQSAQFPNYCYLSPEIINGIVPEKAVSELKVYPNPVSSNLFVQFTKNTAGNYTLELYSVKGELVKTECLEPGSNLHQIDTGSLQCGIYILRLVSDSGKYAEEIIVIKQ